MDDGRFLSPWFVVVEHQKGAGNHHLVALTFEFVYSGSAIETVVWHPQYDQGDVEDDHVVLLNYYWRRKEGLDVRRGLNFLFLSGASACATLSSWCSYIF